MALCDAAVAAIMMVLLAGTNTPDWLRYLLMQIREVVAHAIHHGGTRALTVPHLCLHHKMDLRKVALRILTTDEIPEDIESAG